MVPRHHLGDQVNLASGGVRRGPGGAPQEAGAPERGIGGAPQKAAPESWKNCGAGRGGDFSRAPARPGANAMHHGGFAFVFLWAGEEAGPCFDTTPALAVELVGNSAGCKRIRHRSYRNWSDNP